MMNLMFRASKTQALTIGPPNKNRSETILRAVLNGFPMWEGQVIGENEEKHTANNL